MKVEIINKSGKAWMFQTEKKASPFIKRTCRNNFKIIDGIKVYDDRNLKLI